MFKKSHQQLKHGLEYRTPQTCASECTEMPDCGAVVFDKSNEVCRMGSIGGLRQPYAGDPAEMAAAVAVIGDVAYDPIKGLFEKTNSLLI